MKNQDPDPDEQPRSFSEGLKKTNFWVKILKFFDVDPGWEKVGFGIRDKHSKSTTKKLSKVDKRTWRSDHEDALPGPADPLEEVRHDEGQDHSLLQQGLRVL